MTLLKVDPPAIIRFKVDKPDTESHKSIITIENTGSDPAAFKLKTTAPDSFGLKPNTGTLKPGEKAQVQVLLQLKGIDKAHNAKFQIQAAKSDDTSLPSKEQWTAWSKEPNRVQEHLLTVLCDAMGAAGGTRSAPVTPEMLKSFGQGGSGLPGAPNTEQLLQYSLVLEREVKVVQEHVLRFKQSREHVPQSKQRALVAAGVVFLLSRLLRRRANHNGFFALLYVMMRDSAFTAAVALAFALGQQRKLRAGA